MTAAATADTAYIAEMMARPFVQKVHDVVKAEGGLNAVQVAKKAGYGVALTVTALTVLHDAGYIWRGPGMVWHVVPESEVYERRVDLDGNEYIVTV